MVSVPRFPCRCVVIVMLALPSECYEKWFILDVRGPIQERSVLLLL